MKDNRRKMQADVTFSHGSYVLGNDLLVYESPTLSQVICSLLNAAERDDDRSCTKIDALACGA